MSFFCFSLQKISRENRLLKIQAFALNQSAYIFLFSFFKDAKAKGFGKKPEMNQKRRRGNFMRNQMRGGRMHRGRHMGRGGPRGMFQ